SGLQPTLLPLVLKGGLCVPSGRLRVPRVPGFSLFSTAKRSVCVPCVPCVPGLFFRALSAGPVRSHCVPDLPVCVPGVETGARRNEGTHGTKIGTDLHGVDQNLPPAVAELAVILEGDLNTGSPKVSLDASEDICKDLWRFRPIPRLLNVLERAVIERL